MLPYSVSVCMATYNGELFLSEQIDSILVELSDQDELVVVDDGSTDATISLLLSYAAKDARVKLFRNTQNMGVIKTFEFSLSKAQNEIIFLADQDDIWQPGRVSACLEIFDKSPEVSAVLVNAEVLAFHECTGISFYTAGSEPKLSIISQLYINKFIGCCMCFRKSILTVALPFASRISMHDWWLGCCALLVGNVYFLNENKIYYRRHSSNASPSSSRDLYTVFKSRLKDIGCFFELLIRHFGQGFKRVK